MKRNNLRSKWLDVKDLHGDHQVRFGQHLSYQFQNSPRRILYMMSYYKFASKMIGKGKKVLDVGCGEGLGTWLLACECGWAKGVDLDCDAVEIGKNNWKDQNISFACSDFLSTRQQPFDAVVSFDVVEHINPDNMDCFWQKISKSLARYGSVVIGTPNITAAQYASRIAKAGHVNLYSGERLENEMRQYFKHVFIFGANDEVVHTGFLPMAHYLIGVGCGKIIQEKKVNQ